MKAVIMCGGAGSRLKPLTESKPKPLLKLLNRPVIDIVIEHLIKAGIREIYVSVGYMADEIIRYCESRSYEADIIIKEEKFPLGTAGGVKNCISETDDDVLVVSGDNVFDFDIEKIYDFHYSCDSDVTVCGVLVEDPREYGVILKDDDGSISSFVEKPTWEKAQSFLANTGIYLLRGNVLKMIPKETKYDFSDDLFPELFRSEKRFMCYEAQGFWGDMGEFPAYFDVTKSILDGCFGSFRYEGCLISEDVVLENNVIVKAPCVFAGNVILGKNTVIGPYTVIGENTVVGEDSSVSSSIIGENCRISENCEINKIITSDMVSLSDNCSVEENVILGYGCNIGRFTRILRNSKIWPGRRISNESVISKDMLYETPSEINFDIFGLSGKINSQISVSDVTQLGQAIASVKEKMKIGLSCDGKQSSEVYKDLCASGMRSCSGSVYDFGESAKVQAYFYSAYCNLDAYVFVSTNGDIVNLSFFGSNGMPIDAGTARKINNLYKFSAYNFCSPEKYTEMFNMSLFSTVYKSYLNKMTGEGKLPFNVVAESDNKYLKELLTDVFSKKCRKDAKVTIQLLVNSDGTDVYIVENEKFYSSERILLFLSEMAFAGNRDVIIPEDAPSLIEEKAQFYKRHAIRQFAGAKSGLIYSHDVILDNIWCFDPIMMCARLMEIVSGSDETLEQLFEYQNDFALRKSIIEFDGAPGQIRRVLENCGAQKFDESHFVLNTRKGRARIRQLGNSSRVRVLAESADMETAKELSIMVAEKIKNANIDKV